MKHFCLGIRLLILALISSVSFALVSWIDSKYHSYAFRDLDEVTMKHTVLFPSRSSDTSVVFQGFEQLSPGQLLAFDYAVDSDAHVQGLDLFLDSLIRSVDHSPVYNRQSYLYGDYCLGLPNRFYCLSFTDNVFAERRFYGIVRDGYFHNGNCIWLKRIYTGSIALRSRGSGNAILSYYVLCFLCLFLLAIMFELLASKDKQ